MTTMMRTVAGAVAVVSAACVAVVSPAAAGAARAPGDRTFYVGSCHRNSFDTIQGAIDAAAEITAPRPPDGIEVAVCPGEYEENVTVRRQRNLNLRAAESERPTIVAAGDGPALTVRGSTGTQVRGFRFRDASRVAVRVVNSPSTRLRGNDLSDGAVGMLVTASPDTRVITTPFYRFTDAGLVVTDSDQVRVRFNYFSDNDTGVSVHDSSDALIEANYAVNAGRYGVLLDDVSDSLLYDNTTDRNDYGLALVASTGNTIRKQFGRHHPIAGVSLDAASTGNLVKNSIWGASGTDAVDASMGDGTAGTGNTWTGDRCETAQPAGVCEDAR